MRFLPIKIGKRYFNTNPYKMAQVVDAFICPLQRKILIVYECGSTNELMMTTIDRFRIHYGREEDEIKQNSKY